MRRVVVTGLGIVSSIGNNAQEVQASLREARSGIVKAEAYEKLGFRCRVKRIGHLISALAFLMTASPGTA